MYSGADWIKRNLHQEMSELGIAVADILGYVWRGIYHIGTQSLRKVDWGHDFYISIVLYSPNLATYDFNTLTELVIVCHDAMIRMEVNPRAFKYIELIFHQRHTREGCTMERMPTIENHLYQIRDDYLRNGYEFMRNINNDNRGSNKEK